MEVEAVDHTTQSAGVGFSSDFGLNLEIAFVGVQPHPDDYPIRQVEEVNQSVGGFARWMSLRSQGIPKLSTFSHCDAVRRIERCSSLSSGAFGGRPRGRFLGSTWRV
jgi:hypothetical protein